jgi:hypothetical protein
VNTSGNANANNGTQEHKRLNAEADRYFRFNAQPVHYLEHVALDYTRTGTVLNPTALPLIADEGCIPGIPTFDPVEELVTAFGSAHEYRPGKFVTLKVLAADLPSPSLDASVWICEKRYEVIGFKPEYRGSLLWRYDLLLGYT